MADDEDTESEDEVEYSGMIQPPLINQLKTILAEYPDDGQILKELIQNAEDAGAGEMKILYDDRRTVEGGSNRKTPFRKYFQGPALIVYNNAAFTEEDWTGIKMLYSSIKEFDRTKVGRFGLGFKSVFHITDYPLVVSGKQLLVIDPHQDSSRVCQTMQLKKLNKYRKMKVEDCAAAFFGVFGFCQMTLDEGYFNGTMFRFPLRQIATDLSDNIYDEKKVEDLLKSLKGEAPLTLLFLKCMEKISVFKQSVSVTNEASAIFYFSVHIDSPTDSIRKARGDLHIQIQQLQNDLPPSTIQNQYTMAIIVTNEDGSTAVSHWKVMNMFKGGAMSENLRRLSEDHTLSYSPYVSVALDLENIRSFAGHIFCFLPLPMTEHSLTGLPLHINGFFALSQNRRVVKWPTADQIRNDAHTDKSLRWNRALVEEVLSELYASFVRDRIEESIRCGNPDEMVSSISRCIPNPNNINDNWKILIKPLQRQVIGFRLFFTKNRGGKWLQMKDAIFLRKQWQGEDTADLMLDVQNVLYDYDQNIVEIEDHVWDFLDLNSFSVQIVSPDFLYSILSKSDKYSGYSKQKKYNFIRYLLSEGNMRNLESLFLLPLQTGSFTSFIGKHQKKYSLVYVCSKEQRDILHGMTDCMLGDLPKDLLEKFDLLASEGYYQLKRPDGMEMVHLLKMSINRSFGCKQGSVFWNTRIHELKYDWMQRLWAYIYEHFPCHLNLFENVSIMPSEVKNDLCQLHKLSEIFVCGNLMTENVSKCLNSMSIIVLNSIPHFIQKHPQVHKYVYKGTPSHVAKALERVYSKSNWYSLAEEFNSRNSTEEKTDFLLFLSKEKLHNSKAQTFTCHLDLFNSNKSDRLVSISCVKRFITKEIPVKYPSEILVFSNTNVQKFAKSIGAIPIAEQEMFVEILKCLVNQTFYCTQDVKSMMKYITDNKIYNKSDEIFSLVQKVPFVPSADFSMKAASDLFDPKDPIVSKIIKDVTLFPEPKVASEKNLKILRKLGLKSAEHLSAEQIYDAAKYLHTKSENKNVTDEDRNSAAALLETLVRKPNLLNDKIHGCRENLLKVLMKMKIIVPLQRTQSYIHNLPWFSPSYSLCSPSEVYNSKYEMLIGCVAPLLPTGIPEELTSRFDWYKKPRIEMILAQHSIIRNCYLEEYNSEYVYSIKKIYQYLADEFEVYEIPELKEIGEIWMGNGFCSPTNIYINEQPDDIVLTPYMFHLPMDFQSVGIRNLAVFLGCVQQQTTKEIIKVQHMVKAKHSSYNVTEKEYKRDLDLIIRILNKLKSEDSTKKMNVLFPIHTNDNRLILRHAKECNYCNEEWLKEIAEEEGEEMFFVHANIPLDTASKLGVPSLTESLLEDTEGIQNWGQTEPTTRRIKNLLSDYKDGFVVPKELIQNADDAGAEKVCFLYDERENPECRTKLIDENMSSCQGPALWAYNDAQFSQDDLENITKLSGATKADDLTKIGKFGLGFCSVYNLTDVPSFVTGSCIVIFDPHAKYLGKAVKKDNPGMKIDLRTTKNKILLKRMNNQFKPFCGVFGCNLQTEHPSFSGTLFRFPLRTRKQACESEICDIIYDEKEMKSMISLYIENASNLLLFTHHVKIVEFYYLPKYSHVKNAVLLHRISREEIHPGNTSISSDFFTSFSEEVEHCKRYLKRNPPIIKKCSLLKIKTQLTENCQQLFSYIPETTETKWLISWASGTDSSVDLAKKAIVSGALPLASVAAFLKDECGFLKCECLKNVPLGFYRQSHIFCFLPLPVITSLPFHINGSFAVSSNRRQLLSRTSDDKNDFENQWNEVLMGDAVTNAYLHLLESLQSLEITCDKYSNLWPCIQNELSCEPTTPIIKSFYELVVQQNRRVFCRQNIWVSLDRCIFVDAKLMTSDIGEIVLNASVEYLEKNGDVVVQLEENILDNFKHFLGCFPAQIQSRIYSSRMFYEKVFFPNLQDKYWDDDSREKILFYALDHLDEEIKEVMTTVPCIPTQPNGVLKRPDELVSISGKVAKLFWVEDEKFAKEEFEMNDRHKRLITMGMVEDEINQEMLIERVSSIPILADTCVACALERCKFVSSFLQMEHLKETSKHIQHISFLPVLSKPKGWHLLWFADGNNLKRYTSVCSKHNGNSCHMFARPADLFSETCQNLVGCIQLVLDESFLESQRFEKETLLRVLGVTIENEIDTEIIVRQLKVICQTFEITALNCDDGQALRDICEHIYQRLNAASEKCNEVALSELANVPCLLIDNVFVKPQFVAITSPVDCSPSLYCLDRLQLKTKKNFLQAVGVKNTFEISDVSEALRYMVSKYGREMTIEPDDLVLACKLVDLLAKLMSITSSPVKDKDLYIPDEDEKFNCIDNLCLDDSEFLKKGNHLKYPNPKISVETARIVGVRSKARGSLQQFSRGIRPFGQKEELTTRIKRILSGYPCDEGILKEMLQNADDAGATEIKFITDFNQYPVDKIFDECWKPLQGPALIIHNNAYFTEKDLEGIQHLGIGAKGDDPTKTGQYGVGFNAVYHITDVPSFISKPPDTGMEEYTLCALDPHCSYVPDATKAYPGKQYTDLSELKNFFPDVFSCYHEDILLQDKGTVFRLPLRTSVFAESSELSREEVTEQKIKALLKAFESEMANSLLFLKNIRNISIGRIQDGELKEIYQVDMTISTKDLSFKVEFDNHVMNVADILGRDVKQLEKKEVKYFLTVKESNKTETKWCILQQIGFDKNFEIPEAVNEKFRSGSFGLLPYCGVAMPLNKHVDLAKAYCFLPLPINTGLTMHINGHFALNYETRRELYTGDKPSYRSTWNEILLKEVVAPLYANALQTKLELMDIESTDELSQNKIVDKLHEYHKLFPDVEYASDAQWKMLVTSVYKFIHKTKMKLFVSFVSQGKNNCRARCLQIINEENIFANAVFNVDYLPSSSEEEKIIHLSKDMGMALVDTPCVIWKNLNIAEIKTQILSPDWFIYFLKSNKMCITGEKCNTDTNDLDLQETIFKTVSNVKLCLQFCMKSEHFEEEVSGLPLCVTANNSLKYFCREKPIILSFYWVLFQNSKEWFLHPDLHSLLNDVESQCITSLTIETFDFFLHRNLNSEIYKHCIVHWDRSEQGVPSKPWIKLAWNFIQDCVKENVEKRAIVDMLRPLSQWSIIPVTRLSDVKKFELQQTEFQLMPMQSSKYIIDLPAFTPALQTSISKLKLPFIDQECLPSQHPLRKLIVAQDCPLDVLTCLHHYRDTINENNKINWEDCDTILEYLAGGFENMQMEENRQLIKDRLKELSLFTNVHKTRVNLKSSSTILALPMDLPHNGMSAWASETGTLLLRQNDRLKYIFYLLGAAESTACDVYSTHILPHFHYIPSEDMIFHLIFIRDKLLCTSGEYGDEQHRLIKALKGLSFVPLGDGRRKKASAFFSPSNVVMKSMCLDPKQFPPEPFCSDEWKTFMELAGVKAEITSELFIRFAKELEVCGCNGYSEDLATRSKVLVMHLMNNIELIQEGTFKKIQDIKFVAPYIVKEFYAKMCKAYGSGGERSNYLIAFKGATREKHEHIAWTTCNIIPKWAELPKCYQDFKMIKKQIGMKKPSIEMVVSHVRNVCSALERMSENEIVNLGIVKITTLMKQFYKYFSYKENLESTEIDKLKSIPFVFIKESCLFIPCDKITLQMTSEQEMKPYAMTAPVIFGEYFEVFERLGASKQVTSNTYAKVLELIYKDTQGQLQTNELRVARDSIQQFLSLLSPDPEISGEVLTVEHLYLLSTDEHLYDSTELVYSDKKYLQTIIESNTSENMKFLCVIDEKDTTKENKIKTLPQKYRPPMLSEIVKIECDVRSMIVSETKLSTKITTFLTSEEFASGLIRIIQQEKELSFDEERAVKNKLSMISVKQAKNLDTAYLLKGRKIHSAPRFSHYVHIKGNTKERFIIYHKNLSGSDAGKWLINNVLAVFRALRDSTGLIFTEYATLMISSMFQHVEYPEKIKPFLDSEGLSNLSSQAGLDLNSKLPPPGSPVPVLWHAILDNSFVCFEAGDYVALLIDENKNGDFIFHHAVVVEKIQNPHSSDEVTDIFLQEYVVQISRYEKATKKAYELYKFNRSKQFQPMGVMMCTNEAQACEKDQEIKDTGAAQEGESDPTVDPRPLNEILNEIKEILKSVWHIENEKEKRLICKRLVRKWHPYKNPADVERTTTITQYILNLMNRLEAGENIDNDENVHPKTPHSRSWCDDMYDDIERAFRREREYRERYKPSNRPHKHSQHSERFTETNPQPGIARKWLMQAEHDLRSSKEARSCDRCDNNWICYMAHQAAEKALTALQYDEDARCVSSFENLTDLSGSFGMRLKTLAQELQDLTEGSRRMRYPDGMHVPSSAYTKHQADEAIRISQQILENVNKTVF